MKIHFDETELHDIIKEHLINQMPDLNNRTFEIQLIAGRGDNGHRAEIEVLPVQVAAPKAANEAEESTSEDEAALPFNFGDEAED